MDWTFKAWSKPNPETVRTAGSGFGKHLPIIVAQENVRASIAPGHHMVERTFEFNPQWTNHARKLAGFTGWCKLQDLNPFFRTAGLMRTLMSR